MNFEVRILEVQTYYIFNQSSLILKPLIKLSQNQLLQTLVKVGKTFFLLQCRDLQSPMNLKWLAEWLYVLSSFSKNQIISSFLEIFLISQWENCEFWLVLRAGQEVINVSSFLLNLVVFSLKTLKVPGKDLGI